MVPTGKVKPYGRNPRKNEAAVDKVATSIQEFGFRQPIVVDGAMVVIAGHTRLLAAKKLGLKEVPVHVAEMSDAQAQAYRLADNRTAQDSEWDEAILSGEIRALKANGFDLTTLGFTDDEIDGLLVESTAVGETDPDDIPSVPADEPITKRGDLILLGAHRLLCGDSTSPSDFATLMGEELADCVWTDPPYGVAYVGGTKDKLTIENDDLNEHELEAFLGKALGCACDVSRAGASWYVAAPAGPLHLVFSRVLRGLGVWRQTLNWVKSSLVLGRSDYHYRHEPIFYGWKDGAAHSWYGDRKQSTILEFNKPSKNADHPTMKPVELVEYCLLNSTRRGDIVLDPFAGNGAPTEPTDDIVLDPFGGSGTTLIACEKNGRRARLMELDPRYCDVIVRRWEEFTGREAKRPDGP